MYVVREKVCRGCLKVSTVEFPVVNYILRKNFAKISGLIISNANNLPCSLCRDCLRLLKQFVRFRNKCNNAHEFLTQMSGSMNGKQFNIEELHKERKKHFDETNFLALTEILNIECSKQKTQLSGVFKNGMNPSEKTVINGEAQLNKKSLNGEQFFDDYGSFSEVYHFTASHIKNIQNDKLQIPTNKFISFESKDLENCPLIYFATNKENTHIKIEFDEANANNIEEINGRLSPAIKKEFNIDNEDLFSDNGEHYDDFIDKSLKTEAKFKTKKKNIRDGKKIGSTKLKKQKISKKNYFDGVIGDPIKGNEKKARVIYFHFDENAVIVKKLSVPEQERALETARSEAQYVEAPFKCVPCAKYFLHQLSLQGHLKRHDRAAGEYVCPICTQRYSSPRNLRNHQTIHEERLQCKRCSRVVRGRAAMAKHIATHDGFCPKFECEVCGKITASKRNHKRHMLVHACPSVAKKHKCPHCPRTFSLTSSRNDHATRAHTTGDRYFRCDLCERTFLNKTCLRIHAVSHSDKKDFYCVECDKSFKRQSTLDNHLKVSIRHGNYAFLKYKCGECWKRFDTALKLQAHADCAHRRLLKWSCERCPAKFLSRSGLSLHRRKVHEGRAAPKNHVCSVCGKSFTCKFSLDKHVRVHTGELPFSCEICGRPFCQKSTLETHVKLVHLKLKRPFGKRLTADIKKNIPTDVELPAIDDLILDNKVNFKEIDV